MTCPSKEQKEHELGTLCRECDACLEYLNACRTLIEIRYDFEGKLDKELNVKGGIARANGFTYAHEYNLQEMFVFMKRLEAITAEFSYLYSQKVIKERVPDPDVLRRKKDPQEFQKALAEQKLANRPAKERKHLSERDKAIAALTGVGLSLEDATASVDAKFKEQGKVTS